MRIILKRPRQRKGMRRKVQVSIGVEAPVMLEASKSIELYAEEDACILQIDHEKYPVYAHGCEEVELTIRMEGLWFLPYAVPYAKDGTKLHVCFGNLPNIWDEDKVSLLSEEMRHVCYARRVIAADSPDELLLESDAEPCIAALSAIGAESAADILRDIVRSVPEAASAMDRNDDGVVSRLRKAAAIALLTEDWTAQRSVAASLMIDYALENGVL